MNGIFFAYFFFNSLNFFKFIVLINFETMKKIILSLGLLLSLSLTLVSCHKENSDDVNQDKIYTVYEVFYNKNTDKTVVVARFKFGNITGTNLELSNGAYVLFGSDTLYYSAIYTGHAKEYAGEITTGTFTYKDTDNNVYVNSVPAYQPIAFDPSFTTITKSQANTLTWVGNALGPNENVGVFVGSWTWGQDALFFQDLDGATDIVMGVNQLSNLATGTSTVYMDRTTEVNVSQGTGNGGIIRHKYRAMNQSVNVVP